MCFYFLALQTLDNFKELKGFIIINHFRLDFIKKQAEDTEVANTLDRLCEYIKQWIKTPQDQRQPLTQLYIHRFLRLQTITGFIESALLHIGQRNLNNDVYIKLITPIQTTVIFTSSL